MTVEITPSGPASIVARQLLTVAENDPRFGVDDVKTTTSGPMGLAFLVPDELYAAWENAYLPKADDEADSDVPETPKRGRGRPRKADSTEE
jgi:hypothetical protein